MQQRSSSPATIWRFGVGLLSALAAVCLCEILWGADRAAGRSGILFLATAAAASRFGGVHAGTAAGVTAVLYLVAPSLAATAGWCPADAGREGLPSALVLTAVLPPIIWLTVERLRRVDPAPERGPAWLGEELARLRRVNDEYFRLLVGEREARCRMQAQADAVRGDESRFRRLAESNLIGVISTDSAGRVTEANDAFLQMIGHTRAEMLEGRVNWREMTPDEHAARDRRAAEELSASGVCTPYEKSLMRRDGGRVRVLLGGAQLESAGAGAVFFVLDLTERKRAEEDRKRLLRQLEAERALLEAVLRQMPAGVVIAEAPTGRLILGNRQMEHILRRPLVRGTAIESYQSSVTGDAEDPAAGPEEWPLSHSLRTGEVVEAREVAFQRADGMRGTMLVSSAPIRDGLGRIVAGVATFHDVTEHRRAEEGRRFLAEAGAALAGSLDYQTTLERVARLAVPHLADWCLIDVADADGTIRRVASAHCDPAKEELARSLRRYPPDPEKSGGVARVLRTGRSEVISEVTDSFLDAGTRDDRHRALVRELGIRSCMIVPMVARGRTLGAIVFAMSGSGRCCGPDDLAFAEQLARSAALAVDNARLYHEARQANQAKDEFLSVVSHELRTPLTAMLGWVRLLRSGRLDSADARRALETIETNVLAQTRIVNDLLDVGRIVAGKLNLEERMVDPTTVIEEALDIVRPAAQAGGIELRSVLDARARPVLGDHNRLLQVVWNLLTNALKFTPRGGRVEIGLIRCGFEAEITVRDTGIGIRPDFLPHVFERFRQGDAGSARRHDGLGLGLAIAQHLVQLHGGTIRAFSEGEGRGALFTVRLPLADDAAADADSDTSVHTEGRTASRAACVEAGAERVGAAHAADRAPELVSLSGLRVLLVDDKDDTRRVMGKILELAHARVATASSCAEALEAIAAAPPDVLVSDIGMPGEDGYSLIRKVRSLDPNLGGGIPAVALTGFAGSEDRARSLAAGFQMHLAKPIEPEQLVGVIAELGRRNAAAAGTA